MFLHKIDEVNFEGTIVKPRSGVYRCPYCKGDPRYPAPTWKTLKGFESHMKGCGGKPSAVEAKNQRNAEKESQDAIKAEKQKELDAIAKDTSPIKIGDKVHLCDYYVSKPTHEQRGNRMVKVRYEEGRVYYGRTCEVIDIKADEKGGIMLCANNKWYWLSHCLESLEVAKSMADDKQKGYDSACHEASMYR